MPCSSYLPFDREWVAKIRYSSGTVRKIHARRAERQDALRWLEKAVDKGFADIDMLDKDPDLAPLKGDPEYARIRARVKPKG